MRNAFTLSLVLAVLGCGDGIVQVGTTAVEVRTDRTAYVAAHIEGEGEHAQFAFVMRLSVTNVGTGTVFLPRCRPGDNAPSYGIAPVSSRDEFGAAYNPIWACTGHSDHIQLNPGEHRSFMLTLQGPNMWDGRTGVPLGVVEGQMRLAIGVRGTKGRPIEAGEPHGLSNVFTVARSPQPRD
jgi:hypothetical protein